MVKRFVIPLVVVCLIILAGCAAKSSATPMPGVVDNQPASGAPQKSLDTQQSAGGVANTASNESGAQAAEVQRIVIKTANLSIVVKDPSAGMDAIVAMTNSMRGYVVTSNLYRSTLSDGSVVPAATITVRVPAERLTEALTDIKGMVPDATKDILSETVTGQDVTKEYTDLQSQLTNLQSAEKQLQAIMENATKTEDVLAIFNQLTQIRGQIEVIQGQMKYYQESAAMSAITVNITSVGSIKPLSIGGWQPVGVARDAIQALIVAFKWLVSALIWIGLFCLPITIVLGVPLYFMIRGFRRWRKAHKPQKSAA